MARYESAMLKSTSGEYEAAAKELEDVVKDNPQWLEPHVELTSLYYKLHKPADGAKERAIVEKLTAEQQARGPGK
jgi:lipopolysaccharide biosynthesis regulator YciM